MTEAKITDSNDSIRKVRKRPVEVMAMQYTGTDVSADACVSFASSSREILRDSDGLKIITLEGVMLCRVGDWIIRGVNGEFYPCANDIFHKTYEFLD